MNKNYILRVDDDALLDEECNCYKIILKEIKDINYCIDFSVEKVGDDFICLSGNVKWDGCINFKTHETMLFHLCDPKEVEDVFGKIIQSVYFVASEYLISVDYKIPIIKNIREIK